MSGVAMANASAQGWGGDLSLEAGFRGGLCLAQRIDGLSDAKRQQAPGSVRNKDLVRHNALYGAVIGSGGPAQLLRLDLAGRWWTPDGRDLRHMQVPGGRLPVKARLGFPHREYRLPPSNLLTTTLIKCQNKKEKKT